MAKLIDVANRALEFRKQQECLLGYHGGGGCSHSIARKLGDVTTINLTYLKAGVSADGGKTYSLNVIPNEAEAGFDIRVHPEQSLEEMGEMLTRYANLVQQTSPSPSPSPSPLPSPATPPSSYNP